MKYAPGNAQHAGARETQQDAFAFSDPERADFTAHGGFLAIVADGMGGLAHGGAASGLAVRSFLEAYLEKTPEEAIGAALERSLRQANSALHAQARQAGMAGEMGTTLAAAVVHQDELHWVSAGDSRIYLLREGRLSQVTSDHTHAADLDAQVAAGRLDAGQAQADPDREALISFLGGAEVARVDRNERPFGLRPGDRVLLCSDGLYRALSDEQIVASAVQPPHAMCESLVAQALAKQHPRQDNVTVLAIGCEPEAPLTQRAPSTRPETAQGSRTLVLVGLLALVLVLLAWWLRPPDPAGSPPSPRPTASAPEAQPTPVEPERRPAGQVQGVEPGQGGER